VRDNAYLRMTTRPDLASRSNGHRSFFRVIRSSGVIRVTIAKPAEGNVVISAEQGPKGEQKSMTVGPCHRSQGWARGLASLIDTRVPERHFGTLSALASNTLMRFLLAAAISRGTGGLP
jgi:hypothetical protein